MSGALRKAGLGLLVGCVGAAPPAGSPARPASLAAAVRAVPTTGDPSPGLPMLAVSASELFPMSETPAPDEVESTQAPYDCLVISDLHLGSEVCQARLLEQFLEWAVLNTRMLVINGDIFDDLNFKRLSKRHFACLKVIRRNSDRDDFQIVWIRGNHDGPAETISHIVGVEIRDEYIFDNGKLRLLILHGDQFDRIVTRHKRLTGAAIGLFYLIQKTFPHNAARWIRRMSKRFQRNSPLVRASAIEYAQSKGCRYVTCGHTHLELTAEQDGIRYFNTGTWTETPPCPFLAVRGAAIGLEHWPLAPEPGSAVESGHVIAEPTGDSLR